MLLPTTPAEAGKFRRHTIQPEEAQRILLERAVPLENEIVSLSDAWGRRLAEDVHATEPFPPFRRSGMDGYAVRTEDLLLATPDEPAILSVVEAIPCGAVPARRIAKGQAARIMTGGMVPDGADAVVMLEMTRPATEGGDGSLVAIAHPIPAGRNVADVGCEMSAGQKLLTAGQVVLAGESALLAACGFARVPVVCKPKVAILSTGSELLEVDEPLQPGRIRNSNSIMLEALVKQAGAEPVVLGRVPDDVHAAQALVERGLAEADLMLTTGGVSVGDYDIMVDLLARWDGRTLFNKVAMRPGSPTTAAESGEGRLLLALSGNPGACFVGFHLFALPVIRTMLGSSEPLPERFEARLAESFPKVNAYTRFIRSRTEISRGTLYVRPTGDDKSSLMTTIVGADCLIVIPPTKEGFAQGELVEAIRL
ncbi:gephyrin-like molybdotransferase Glp [Cohnella faecalis]|uniref:molybdopterin molybdotransferase MoeA n=1 Tax=Cohnella faecalis TaxID=2315694 RepID=UPI00361490AD